MSLDVQSRISHFLAMNLSAEDLTLRKFKRHIEGFSWETYSVAAQWTESGATREQEFIIHRAPEVGIIEPYDARGLFDLLTALNTARGVPVATPRWLDEDGATLGRPGYVVDLVTGDVPTPWTVSNYFTTDEDRYRIGSDFAALAAAIHKVPIDTLPRNLTGISSADAVGSIIERWEEQYLRNRLEPFPPGEYLFEWLKRNKNMASGHVGLVHGDFRTGNFMVRDGSIVAMLDWETAHVGDPVADLACATLKQLRGGRLGDAGGLLPLDDFISQYEDHAGWQVPREAIQYWWVFISTAGIAQWAAAMRHFEEGKTGDARYPTVGYQTLAYPVKDALRNIAAIRAGDAPWP